MDIEASRTVREAAISHLTESLKWWIGAAGATGTVLVTAIRLDPPSLDGALLVAYLVAGGAAVGCALVALFWSAKVLCVPRVYASELAAKEAETDRMGTVDLNPLAVKGSGDDVTWVQQVGGPALLGTSRSVTEVIQQTQHGTDEAAKTEAFSRLGLIESTLHLHRVQDAYDRLVNGAWVGGVIFVISLLALVSIPNFAPAPDPSPKPVYVTKPIKVTIHVMPEAKRPAIPRKCGTVFTGTAIGGTLDRPKLVVDPSSRCGPLRVMEPVGLIVIPE